MALYSCNPCQVLSKHPFSATLSWEKLKYGKNLNEDCGSLLIFKSLFILIEKHFSGQDILSLPSMFSSAAEPAPANKGDETTDAEPEPAPAAEEQADPAAQTEEPEVPQE